MPALKRFNIRVYGLLINEHGQLLVSDEFFKTGNRSTKFPGGGLELGEGLIEGLIREFKEETGLDVSVKEHFYTTDFFQKSYFDNESQIISIYYLCECSSWQKLKTSDKKFDFEIPQPGGETESFRWIYLKDLKQETEINLPIDKIVADKLAARFN